jgi:hypothetical protein
VSWLDDLDVMQWDVIRKTAFHRAQADLEQYGPFEVTVSEALDIPPLRTSTAGAFPD